MTIRRCNWCEKDDLYRNYHDKEWGKPIYEDTLIFEFLVLESFQAGLSWYTILKKREAFRNAFDGFNYAKIALYTDVKVNSLLQNENIIRHRAKILATINNAQQFIKIQKEFGYFSTWVWGFVKGKPIINYPKSLQEVPPSTEISDQLAKELKKRGFKFLGTTTVYAFMQAIGMINDHLTECSFK